METTLCRDILGIIACYLTTEDICKNGAYELFTIKTRYSNDDWIYATKYGRVNMLKWLDKLVKENSAKISAKKSKHLVIRESLIDLAARFGKLSTLKWLYKNTRETCSTWAIDLAAGCQSRYSAKHLKVIKFLVKKDAKCTYRAIDNAAEYGNLNIIKFIHKNVKPSYATTSAVDYAAHNGHLKVIKWLLKNRQEGGSILAMSLAAENNHLKVVKWLHKNYDKGCSNITLSYVAIRGHLRILKWFYKNRKKDYYNSIHHINFNWMLMNCSNDIIKFIYDTVGRLFLD
jgi:hypothetical protein